MESSLVAVETAPARQTRPGPGRRFSGRSL